MKKRFSLYVLVAMIVGMVVTACGGGGDGPPVKMQKYEGSDLTIEYPKDWKESSMDVFGMTIAIFGMKELSMAELQNLDFENMVTEDPIALIMKVPGELTSQMGIEDIDAAMAEFDTAIPQDEAEIVKQGETTLGDAKGKYVIAKGKHPQMGEIGLHLAVARRDDGTVVVFMGATPEKDRDKNLDIFDYMHKSLKFK